MHATGDGPDQCRRLAGLLLIPVRQPGVSPLWQSNPKFQLMIGENTFMALDLTPLDSASRLLVEAELKVATGGGGRFQPTGFPGPRPRFIPRCGRGQLAARRITAIDGEPAGTSLLGGWRRGNRSRWRLQQVCKGIPYVLATDSGQQASDSQYAGSSPTLVALHLGYTTVRGP